ncbi:MAG: YeeE/YedE family protein [Oligoflexia bacterium]|nr:YeeE/YedE family protein [Oligoflexia bacterium]
MKPYWNPYLAGTLLGVVLFSAFALTQGGLGASGAISRIQIATTDLFFPSHVDRVGYLAAVAGGEKSALDHSSVVLLLGTFAGGLLSAWLNGRLRAEIIKGPRITNRQRIFFAVLGGAIMGYGARFARGCTSGQALSGGAVLSLGSWTFMFSVFAGGYLVAYFVRKLWEAPNAAR